MNNESFVSVSLSGICVWCEQFSLQTGLQHKQHRMPLRRKSCKYLLIPMITTSQITAIFKHSLLVGNSFESYNDGELLPRSSIHKCMRYIYCFVDIESLVSVDVYLQTSRGDRERSGFIVGALHQIYPVAQPTLRRLPACSPGPLTR